MQAPMNNLATVLSGATLAIQRLFQATGKLACCPPCSTSSTRAPAKSTAAAPRRPAKPAGGCSRLRPPGWPTGPTRSPAALWDQAAEPTRNRLDITAGSAGPVDLSQTHMRASPSRSVWIARCTVEMTEHDRLREIAEGRWTVRPAIAGDSTDAALAGGLAVAQAPYSTTLSRTRSRPPGMRRRDSRSNQGRRGSRRHSRSNACRGPGGNPCGSVRRSLCRTLRHCGRRPRRALNPASVRYGTRSNSQELWLGGSFSNARSLVISAMNAALASQRSSATRCSAVAGRGLRRSWWSGRSPASAQRARCRARC